MRVIDLIKALQKVDPFLPVMVDGQEAGLHECNLVEVQTVALNHWRDDGFQGPHELLEIAAGDDDLYEKETIEALHISHKWKS